MDKEYFKIIKGQAEQIHINGYAQEDIVGDITLFVLEHMKNYPEHSARTVARTVRRAIYRIIRARVTFEGCSDKTRNVRRKLQCPISNIQPLHDTPEVAVDIFESMETNIPGPRDVIAADDLAEAFKKNLGDKELQIYELMLDGYSKPRDICAKIYGEYIELRSKTISKHMISIRRQFAQFYKEETGKIVGKQFAR